MIRQEEIRDLLTQALQLGARGTLLQASSPLLGALPELDSHGVIVVLELLQEHFNITIRDDDVTPDAFARLDTLTWFVQQQINRHRAKTG